MTLLELLLVMMIMGLVVGMGVGVFASLDVGRRQSADMVRGALRTARNAARARRAPAVVQIDAAAGRLSPRGVEVIGTWHFESADLMGAFGIGGVGVGTRLDEDGYIGKALELPAGGNARAELAIQDDPAFDFRDGFVVECAIDPDAARSAHVVNLGNVCGVYLLSTGAVRAWFVPLVTSDEVGRASGQVVLDSAPGLVRIGKWARVRAEYDRRRLVILLDGARIAAKEETAPVAPISGPLMIGGGRRAFEGRVDELVVGAWIESGAVVLPEGARFAAATPPLIAFDASGRLDARAHAGAVDLVLEHDDGREERVHVGAWGTIE
jgi:hypothetical protein